jgi:putative ABC transport system permease protein
VSWLRKYFPRTYFARRNLARARVRTLLAVLVVTAGVVAVGGLGIFGSSFEASQQQNLGDVANEVTVTAPSEKPTRAPLENPVSLDERRLESIRSIAGDSAVTVLRTRPATGRLGNSEIRSVTGVRNFNATYSVVAGELPTNWQNGVVIGSRDASFLQLRVGSPVRVDGRLYRVVAVAGDVPGDVMLPMRLVEPGNETRYSKVVVHADNAVEASRIAADLDTELNRGLERRAEFRIDAREADAEAIRRQFTSTNQFLLGIGSISLVIAGVSITNVQLMSARERRREIGVLRAIGFSQLDILAIMLIETVIMGTVASLVGIVGSLGAGAVINAVLLGDPTAFQPDTTRSLVIAFVVGVLVTLVAGLYPAWTASRERPVDALRDG